MVVLITGARSGFGKLAAVAAARRGHVVYAGLRDVDTADRLMEAAAGLDVRPIQLDITSEADRQAAVERILDEQGRIDGLVNNAGIALGGFLEQVDEDELRKVFEVNVFGTWAMTKAVAPAMRSQGSGSIVMVSSVSGRMAWPCLGTYAGSKFALEGMSEAWRHELRPFGIRVTLLQPGSFRTDIWERNRNVTRNAYDPDSPYAPFVKHVDDLVRRVVDQRAADPEPVADKIVDLLEHPSPRLRYPIGTDAKLRSVVLRVAPWSALEAVLARVLTPPSMR